MLEITIFGDELFDNDTQTFSRVGDIKVVFEHSLASVSKWESRFEKPFLAPGEKTSEEVLGYIQAMIITPDLPPDVLSRLSQENVNQINEYVESKQTATTFAPSTAKGRTEVITSELIYFWMISMQVPMEAQHWHLNRLFSLLRICGNKNSKPKKMSRNELAQRNQALNAERKARLGTTG